MKFAKNLVKKMIAGTLAVVMLMAANAGEVFANGSGDNAASLTITQELVGERFTDNARIYRLVFGVDISPPGLLSIAVVMSYDPDVVVPLEAATEPMPGMFFGADYTALAFSAPFREAGSVAGRIPITDWELDTVSGRQVFGHSSNFTGGTPAVYGVHDMFAFYFRIIDGQELTANTFRLENGRDANGFLAQKQPWTFGAAVMLSPGDSAQAHWWGHTVNPIPQGFVIPDSNIIWNLDIADNGNDQPADYGTLRVSSTTARAGQTATVQINIEDNPGFAAMPLRIRIPAGLTLTSYSLGIAGLAPYFDGPEGTSPGTTINPGLTGDVFMSFSRKTTNFYDNGMLLSLVFAVDAGVAPDTLPIIVEFYSNRPEPFFFSPPTDVNEEYVEIVIVNGHIEVTVAPAFIVGDANQDGRITLADTTRIARWLLVPGNPIIDICLLGADVNGDGVVDADDLILLARWLVGHNVTLFESP